VRTTDAAVRSEAESRLTTTVTVSALFADQQIRVLQDIVVARARQDDVIAALIRRHGGTVAPDGLSLAELHRARDGITGSLLVDSTGAMLEGTPPA
jgi:hypothetical protein